jgi:mannose-1-phosphate guanylyltransferase
MKKSKFYVVILSGGRGARFWPLSTDDKPKQFLNVFGGKSLLRQSVDRLKGVVPKSNILVITSESLYKPTRKELSDLPRENIVTEPCRRDTAAAIATACGVVESRGGDDAIVAILTADHLMNDEEAFRKLLNDSAIAAKLSNNIITMGVAPDHPATGFGYIKCGKRVELGVDTVFFKVDKFVEKPDVNRARRYLATKKYVWNAGMFVWRVATMKEALVKYAPPLAILEASLANEKNKKEVLETLYPQLEPISIDYAVMEKAENIIVSSGDFGWDDVGTWSSADKHMKIDGRRNAVRGNVTLLDVSDSIAVSDGPKIAALGVENLVIVTTKDSVLVASKERVQDLKALLSKMQMDS